MEAVSEWLATLSLERLGGYGILILVLFLFVRGYLITRTTAEKELASLVRGYEAKDQAHAEVLAEKVQRIAALEAEVEDQGYLIERRERQLGVALDEIGPTLIALAEAIQTVTYEATEGGDGHGAVDPQGGKAGR